LAAYRQNEAAPLQELLDQDRPWVTQTVRGWVKEVGRTVSRLGLKRVIRPFRWDIPIPDVAPETPAFTVLSGGRPRVDFRTDPIGIYAFRSPATYGAIWRPTQRKSTGLSLSSSGKLSLVFDLAERARLTLHLRHRALRSFVLGSAPISVSVDQKKRIAGWQPPLSHYDNEALDLGVVDGGEHTLILEVDERSATHYSVLTLKVEARQP
jgi:hypothetical protein